MSLAETVVEGTLKPDGTLELDHKPNLPAGRVTVVLRVNAEATPALSEDWWQYLQRSRRELEAAGSAFMNELEVDAHIAWLRESDPIDELLRRGETL